jgi:hypothetical protein
MGYLNRRKKKKKKKKKIPQHRILLFSNSRVKLSMRWTKLRPNAPGHYKGPWFVLLKCMLVYRYLGRRRQQMGKYAGVGTRGQKYSRELRAYCPSTNFGASIYSFVFPWLFKLLLWRTNDELTFLHKYYYLLGYATQCSAVEIRRFEGKNRLHLQDKISQARIRRQADQTNWRCSSQDNILPSLSSELHVV